IIHSCNVDEANDPFGIFEQGDYVSGFLSEDDALELANQFASSYDAFTVVSRNSGRIASSRSNIVSSESYSRSDSNPFYIVNYDNGQGFIILSRKNIECPILAFIPEGSYSASEYANHDGLSFFFTCAEGYVNKCEFASNDVTVSSSQVTPTRIIRTESVLPIVPVVWGQDSIFGEFCPNKISGCMATALAQIFTVIRPFENLKLTYKGLPSDLCPDIDLEWDSIIRYHHTTYKYINLKEVGESTVDQTNNAADHYNISALMREIGHRIKAEYKDSSTTAYLDKTLHALRYEFGLKNTSDTFPLIQHLNRLTTNFKAGKAVLMMGNAVIRNADRNHPEKTVYKGHAWVSDGYLTCMINSKKVIFYHCNWGLYPKANGFYTK
ncbi:MAG: C10 family peptidase, partial [Allobaculum sp.]|nr:C10 family peptidase [Allobaculum sp.]